MKKRIKSMIIDTPLEPIIRRLLSYKVFNILRRRLIDATARFHLGGSSRTGKNISEAFSDTETLVEFHFQNFSSPDHPCRETLSLALSMLKRRPSIIVETGSSAWGANSSLLFDAYVNSYGGRFDSVDIRVEPMYKLSALCSHKSTFFCDDSVTFLRKLIKKTAKIDLVYLDSWDVDWDDPLPSAIHGFHEFLVILPLLRENGGLLLIDDTPKDSDVMRKVAPGGLTGYQNFLSEYGFPPGKAALVNEYLTKNAIGKKIAHNYQLLWRFDRH